MHWVVCSCPGSSFTTGPRRHLNTSNVSRGAAQLQTRGTYVGEPSTSAISSHHPDKPVCLTVLYLTMRFAKTIKKIQGLQAYHAGDKLNVEVDIVLDASTTLRDSHDLRYVVSRNGLTCPISNELL